MRILPCQICGRSSTTHSLVQSTQRRTQNGQTTNILVCCKKSAKKRLQTTTIILIVVAEARDYLGMTSEERKAKRLTMVIRDPVSGKEVCTLCGANFVYAKTLHDHIESKHLRIMAYSCDFCDKCFTNRGNKYAHVSAHHRHHKKVQRGPAAAEIFSPIS
jgi:hypothetical protein